jgi:hypothetical protein
MGLFLAGAPAIWGDTLWYNGDATRPEFDANSVADPTGDVWIYDDFIVPAGDGAWQVTAVFSNDIFNNNNGPIPTQARWEIYQYLAWSVREFGCGRDRPCSGKSDRPRLLWND